MEGETFDQDLKKILKQVMKNGGRLWGIAELCRGQSAEAMRCGKCGWDCRNGDPFPLHL